MSFFRKSDPVVQKLDPTMIEKFVKSRNWKYLRDQRDNFCMRFTHDDSTGCALTLWLSITGDKKEIYHILVGSDKKIPKSDWNRTLLLCNQWHQQYRWPRVYLDVADWSSDKEGEIVCDHYFDLEAGIHQALLEDLTRRVWGTANSFWEWVHKEHDL